MSVSVEDLIGKHATRGIVVDSHILLLLVVGSYDRTLITRFKRTQTYTEQDYDTLAALLSFFSTVLVTPHVLSEVSSLLNQLPHPFCANCRQTTFAAVIGAVSERPTESAKAARQPAFAKLGLTDSTILDLSPGHLVLTDDFPLAGTLAKLGSDVINFNHIRAW